MKRYLTLMLTLLLILSLSGAAFAAAGDPYFNDLRALSESQQQAINRLTVLNVFEGSEGLGGAFRPDDTVSRAEFAKIICVLTAIGDEASAAAQTGASFHDVNSGWYLGWVEIAAAAGYFQGDADGNFNPADTITAQGAVTVLLRAVGYDNNLSGQWPANYLSKAQELGLTANFEGFSGGKVLTRAEMALLASNMLELTMVAHSTATPANSSWQRGAADAEGFSPLYYSYNGSQYPIQAPGTYNLLQLDLDNKAANSNHENNQSAVDRQFEWHKHQFTYDGQPATLLYRLFVPETTAGESYPLVMQLHGSNGMGRDNVNHMNAVTTTAFAGAGFQAQYPTYVLAVQMPFAGEVSYDAEMAYLYEYGEIIKTIAAEYGNLDLDRIYTTGMSQGAGFSYEAIAMQPDLYAGALILSGTTVHSTWGRQMDLDTLLDVNLLIVHGAKDQYILPVEAHRVYDYLLEQGKENMILEFFTQSGLEALDYTTGWGHSTQNVCLSFEGTPWMTWLMQQRKGESFTAASFSSPNGWNTAVPGVNNWQGYEDEVLSAGWGNIDYIPTDALALSGVSNQVGETNVHLGRLRIGDPEATTYDEDGLTLKPGDILCMTMQGYTGAYGDDWQQFNQDWTVECYVKTGKVGAIVLTTEAIPGLVRPESVMYGGGAGPTNEGSLGNSDTLDGNQVYLRIDLDPSWSSSDGDELMLHVKLTTSDGHEYYKQIQVPVAY